MTTALYPAVGVQRPAHWRRSAWLAWFTLWIGGAAWAQNPATVTTHPSLVLVLNIISDTHVKPVTGLVIAEGMVLVPADFVAAGDEIVVLDGGFSLDQNALPTRTVARSSADGLALLAVEDLQKPAATLTLDPPIPGTRLNLNAYPPAEQLVNGAEPISRSNETPLPNVSGPLFNGCGQLAGIHLASEIQSLEHSDQSRTLLQKELAAGLDALDLDPATAPCTVPASPEVTRETPAGDAKPRGSELEILNQGVNQASSPLPVPAAPSAPPATLSDEPGQGTTETLPDPVPVEEEILTVNPAATPQLSEPEPTRVDEGKPGRLTWLVIGLGLASLAALFVIGRRRSGQSPAGEQAVDKIVDADPAPPAVVRVDARFPDAEKISLEIEFGPENTALQIGAIGTDIKLDHPSVERRHASLQRHGGLLVIARHGEQPGLWINSIPCLDGEIMVIGPEDEVLLGAIVCRIRLEAGT
jgi:hypothetical protein